MSRLMMERSGLIDHIRFVPAWVLSLLAALISAVVAGYLKNYIAESLNYITWSLLLITASFLICILHPAKVWIVPFLCNILVILPAACDDSFWTTSFGIIIGTGVLLSFIAARLGSMIGKKI